MKISFSDATKPPLCKGRCHPEGDGGVVGALRKYAGGIFLASDLGGYAAVVFVLIFVALQ